MGPETGFPQEFVEMIEALVAERVEFLLVGGYAVAVHGFRRATGDIDFLIRPTAENAERTYRALKRFGAPLRDVSVADLARPTNVFQIGNVPIRIDLLGSIRSVDFDEAWKRRIQERIAGIDVPVIGLEDLIRNKSAVNRGKDRLDARELRKRARRP